MIKKKLKKKKKIKIVIDSKILINLKDIDDDTFEELLKKVRYSNPEYYKMKVKMKGRVPKNISPVLVSYKIEKDKISIYRGAIYKVLKVLKNSGYEVKIIDKTTKQKIPYELSIKIDKFKPRDYQKVPVKKMNLFKQGILKAVCGSGKTNIILECIYKNQKVSMIIVNTKRVMKQFLKAIEEKFDIDHESIGQWGDGVKKLGVITVGLAHSVLNDIDYLKDKFGAVYVDECHHTPCYMIENIINEFTAEIRNGVSATTERKDGKEKIMFDSLGQVIHEIPKELLVKKSYLHDVTLIIVPTNFKCKEYDPMKRNSYQKMISKLIIDKERNELIFNYVKKNYDEGHYGLILSDRLKFCKNWKKMLKENGIESMLLIGGNEKEYDEAVELFEKRKLKIAIGTTVAEEGLDIPILDRGYMTCPAANNKRRAVQQSGRLERKMEGKTDAIMYYFWDRYLNGFEDHPANLMKYFNNVAIIADNNELYYLKKDGKIINYWVNVKKNFIKRNLLNF